MADQFDQSLETLEFIPKKYEDLSNKLNSYNDELNRLKFHLKDSAFRLTKGKSNSKYSILN